MSEDPKVDMTGGNIGVGNAISANRGRWSFGGTVPETFVDHIRQSVPLYAEGHELVCQISDFFLRSDSLCYEIGASTGELIGRVARHHAGLQGVRFIGIDNEPPMIQAAKARLDKDPRIEMRCEDAVFAEFEPSDLIMSYYTIQFIHPKFRQDLINRIYNSLNWGGGLLVFEKVRGPDARFQDIQSVLYHRFKRNQGFSDSEILNKTFALSGVLEPFSSRANIEMFERAGFQDVMPVFRWLCFEGYLCIR